MKKRRKTEALDRIQRSIGLGRRRNGAWFNAPRRVTERCSRARRALRAGSPRVRIRRRRHAFEDRRRGGPPERRCRLRLGLQRRRRRSHGDALFVRRRSWGVGLTLVVHVDRRADGARGGGLGKRGARGGGLREHGGRRRRRRAARGLGLVHRHRDDRRDREQDGDDADRDHTDARAEAHPLRLERRRRDASHRRAPSADVLRCVDAKGDRGLVRRGRILLHRRRPPTERALVQGSRATGGRERRRARAARRRRRCIDARRG